MEKVASEFVQRARCRVCGDDMLPLVPVDQKNRLLKVCHRCLTDSEQVLYFMQGVVFGQAVCLLLRHSDIHKTRRGEMFVHAQRGVPTETKVLGLTARELSDNTADRKQTKETTTSPHNLRSRGVPQDGTFHLISTAADAMSSCSDTEIKSELEASEPDSEHEVTVVTCNECGKEFSSEQQLYLHHGTKHEVKKQKQNIKRTKKADRQINSSLFLPSSLLHRDDGKLKAELHTSDEKPKEIPCRACWKVFSTKSALKSHQKLCHKDKFKLQCKLCSKHFFTKKGLTIHMTQTHKASRDCEICGEAFPNYRELYNHKSSKHSHQRCVCHICGKRFKYQGALKGHLDAHAGVKRHFCDVCGKGFVRATSLYGHKANSHSNKPHPSKRPRRSTTGDALQCQLCSETFVSKASLNKHLLNEHSCGPYLETRKTLLPPTEVGSTGPEGAGGSYRCDLCGLVCMTAQGLELHQLQRGECVRTHICPDCGKGFTTAGYLQVHMKQHKEARFQCDECGKKFTYKCNLQSHLSVHKPKDEDKPFQCEVCKKWFRLQSYLDMHIRKHKQELALKCYICGKGLTRPQNLRNHILKMHPEAPQLT